MAAPEVSPQAVETIFDWLAHNPDPKIRSQALKARSPFQQALTDMAAIKGVLAGPGQTLFRDGVSELAARGDTDVKWDEVVHAGIEEQAINALGADLKELNKRPEDAPAGGLWDAKHPYEAGQAGGESLFDGGVKGSSAGAEGGLDRIRERREASQERAEQRREKQLERADKRAAPRDSHSKGWHGRETKVTLKVKDPKSADGKFIRDALLTMPRDCYRIVTNRVKFELIDTNRQDLAKIEIIEGTLGEFLDWLGKDADDANVSDMT
jgi:hypothetical protein